MSIAENVSPNKALAPRLTPPLLVVRDDDGSLLRMLDDLRSGVRPVLSMSDVLRVLIRQAWHLQREGKPWLDVEKVTIRQRRRPYFGRSSPDDSGSGEVVPGSDTQTGEPGT